VSIGVVISGGAPTVHLAAGALHAFDERGLNFDVIATAGAGALPGLLYAAPKNGQRRDALKGVVNLNVHDALYHLIPSNYKVFHKYGPFSSLFWSLGQMIPRPELKPAERYVNAAQRLYNDVVDLLVTAVTPTTLRYSSKSVLTRVQVVNELVDWDALKTFPGEFLLNAFDLSRQELKVFTKTSLEAESFYAALAMPWLYPPTEVGGTLHTEGASQDPSGLEAAMKNASPQMNSLDAIIILDTIGSDVWADPESILEALQISILDPIVTLGENVIALYGFLERLAEISGKKVPRIYRMPFTLPAWDRAKIFEWSYSNALSLWDAGRASALAFCAELSNQQQPHDRYRDFNRVQPNSRAADFLNMFGLQFPNPLQTPPPPPPGGSA
jgi:NTE family protein